MPSTFLLVGLWRFYWVLRHILKLNWKKTFSAMAGPSNSPGPTISVTGTPAISPSVTPIGSPKPTPTQGVLPTTGTSPTPLASPSASPL